MSTEGVLEHERHRHPEGKTASSPGATSLAILALYASIYEYLKLGRSTTPLQVDVPDSAEALHSSISLRRWNRRDRTFPGCGHASNLLIGHWATPTQRRARPIWLCAPQPTAASKPAYRPSEVRANIDEMAGICEVLRHVSRRSVVSRWITGRELTLGSRPPQD
jgi:hypothetical protein